MLSNALKYIRKFHNVSASELAYKIGVSPSYISELEGGKKRINEEILGAYSKAFNMPVSSIYLIAESEDSRGATSPSATRRKIAKIIKWIAEG